MTPANTAESCFDILKDFSFDIPISALAKEKVITKKSRAKISENLEIPTAGYLSNS